MWCFAFMWDFSGIADEAKLSKYFLLFTLAFCFEVPFQLCSLCWYYFYQLEVPLFQPCSSHSPYFGACEIFHSVQQAFMECLEVSSSIITNPHLGFLSFLEALRFACLVSACLPCPFTLLFAPVGLFRLRELCDGERLFQTDVLPPLFSLCCFTALLCPSVCAHSCRGQTVGPFFGVGRLLGGKRDRKERGRREDIRGVSSPLITFHFCKVPDLWPVSFLAPTSRLYLLCNETTLFCGGKMTTSRDEVVKYLLSLGEKGDSARK